MKAVSNFQSLRQPGHESTEVENKIMNGNNGNKGKGESGVQQRRGLNLYSNQTANG